MNPLVLGASAAVGGTLAGALFGARKLLATKSDSQIYGPTLVAGSDTREIAFTFDDGPNDRCTMELLEVFERWNARATFFMVGKFVREAPELVRAVHAQGHIVGNHTMTHPDLTSLSGSDARSEMGDCKHLLEDVLGAPVRYFRCPFGRRNTRVLSTVRDLGMVPVQWNVSTFDWDPIGVNGILQHFDRRSKRPHLRSTGTNLLLHDGCHTGIGADRSATVQAVNILLERMQGEGRRVVTVDAWE